MIVEPPPVFRQFYSRGYWPARRGSGTYVGIDNGDPCPEPNELIVLDRNVVRVVQLVEKRKNRNIIWILKPDDRPAEATGELGWEDPGTELKEDDDG